MIRKINALLRFHYKEDPEKLSDVDWFKRWGELRYCLKLEGQRKTLI